MNRSATSSDSQRERSSVHTNVSDTAAATRWSSHSVIWSQIGPGSPSSMALSASRCTLRSRSRRSCSISAMRSVMPSVSVTCQRAERPRNSSARLLASSSWAIIRGVSSGCRIALSSERSEIVSCSTTETRSCTAPRSWMVSARPSTSRRRCATSAGNPDSSWRARSCSSAASSRRSLDTEKIGTSPTSLRCPRSICSIWRHSG